MSAKTIVISGKTFKEVSDEDVVFVSDNDEVKTVAPPRVLLRAHPSMRGAGRASKPIEAWLSYYTKFASAANTTLPTNFAVQPNLDSSWAAWQGVFDEVKVLEAQLLWNVTYTTAPTAPPAQQPNAVVVYQPSDTLALASVNAGLQYERFQLMNVDYPGVLPYSACVNMAKGGYMTFKTVLPKRGIDLSLVNTLNSVGMFRPTSDASNYVWGTFEAFVAQGGASSVLQIEAFVRMRCEFRTRR
jgi:hypothetical protein